MINPAGIAPPQKILKASVGAARTGVGSKLASMRAKPETNFEAGKDIRPKKGREARVVVPSVALSYQKHLLDEMRADQDGPNVGISLALKDPLMGSHRILANLTPEDADLVFVTNRTHGIGGDNQTMDAHLNLIPTLEAAGAKRRAGQAPQSLGEKIIFAEDVPADERAAILRTVAKVDEAWRSSHQ